MSDDTTANERTETTSEPESAKRTETDADPDRAGALREYTLPLGTTEPEVSFENRGEMRDLFGDARIVALGEATHGTREFFRLKHRFLRHLVCDQGLRVFALEANFPETLAINDYVVHGEGDPREALEGIYFWTWNVESVLDLIEWLREVNAGRPLEERVRFYGIDVQFTSGAVEHLREYFSTVDADVPEQVRARLETVDDDGKAPDFDDGDVQRWLDTGDRLVTDLRAQLDEHREAYVTSAGESAWKLARRHVDVIEQALAYRRAQATYVRADRDEESPNSDDEQRAQSDDDVTAGEALERTLEVRDRGMADNVDWLLSFENTDRIAVWAHDAHVNRSKHVVRGTSISSPSMGRFLADRYGEEYLVLGFAFGRGSFQAMSETDDGSYDLRGQTLSEPLPDSLEATLDSLGSGLSVFDVRSARTDDRLAGWLSEPLRHFSAGATYEPGSPEEYVTEYVYADAFDAVCFVPETTRARPLDREIPE